MYKDRGIIKWAPFDALNGFHEALRLHKYNINKKERPILSEDQFTTMNVTLMESLRNKSEIEIYYFEDGYIKNIFGHIKKIDYIFKNISLDNNIKIEIDDIVDLNNL